LIINKSFKTTIMKKVFPFNWKERGLYNLYTHVLRSGGDADGIMNDTINAHKGRQKRRLRLFFNKVKFVHSINMQKPE